MYKMEVRGSIKFPELNLERELQHIAERIVVPEISGNIAQGTDINGVPYPPLAESTIKMKGHSKPLIGKDRRLFSAGTYKIDRKSKAIVITIKEIRNRVARHLQIDGVRSKKYGLRFFNFFGINKIMEAKAMKFMQTRIKDLTRG